MPMKSTGNNSAELLSIGETARRSGVATSALRFYEARGLISSRRGSGNQRRYHRATLRRIAIIRVAQMLGLSLGEIATAFESLPAQRNPTRRDWERLSTRWGRKLEQRIAELQNLRDRLGGCIGCGCLSLTHCSLYNAGDGAARFGAGPRYLLGDAPPAPGQD
jgi:MerR family redox-sensitive transcriptional activator SoxR